MPAPTYPLHPPGTVAAPRVLLDRYEVGEQIGAGAFATVFAAVDRRTGTEVALKRLPWRADDRLLRRELVALRYARVPGVVPLLDDLHLPDAIWLVLERVRGRPFPGDDVGEPASAERVVQRTRKLLRVVARLHRLGLAHQDLKPHNVLVDDAGEVRVLDLGIASARWLRCARADGFEGTLSYAAPEQRRADLAEDEPWDRRRADLYAVGAMMYEALCGRLMHPEMTPREAWRALVLGDEPEVAPLSGLRPGLPAGLVAFVHRLLATDPAARPADAAEALALLGEPPPGLPRAALEGLPDPVDDAALEALFEGPEVLLHLPSRAARALVNQVGRARAAVHEGLRRWLAAEIVVPVDGLLRVQREALASLELGVAPSAAGGGLLQAQLDLLAARERADAEAERAATVALTALAAQAEDRDALDQALRLVDDEAVDPAFSRDCAALLRFWEAAAVRRDRLAAAAAAFAPSVPLPGELELVYQGARVMAAMAVDVQRAEALLGELARWAEGDDVRLARHATWMGQLRYRQGRYHEAAAAHAASTARRRDHRGRLGSRINELNCLLDAGAFDEVAARAPDLVDDAVALGALRQELQARICELHARYRSGGLVAVDVALLDAALDVQPRDASVLALPMLGSAWREGRTLDVARLTERVVRRDGLGSLAVRALHEALRVESGFEPLTLDAASLAAAARGLPPGVALQAVALARRLVLGDADLPDPRALAARIVLPREQRLELLSVQEALDLLGVDG